MKVANILYQEIKAPITQSLPIISSSGTCPLAHFDTTLNSKTSTASTKDYLI